MSDSSDNESNYIDELLKRKKQLEADGIESGVAFEKAALEQRIQNWPSQWGPDLHVLIYGDFQQPKEQLLIPQLGITVHPDKVEGSLIRSARCVLKATVLLKEKSVAEIVDASRRLNTFLGAWSLVEWGNSACGWWSHLTHGTPGGLLPVLTSEHLPRAIEGILQLPQSVRGRVDAALYWIREPVVLMTERYRSEVLRTYVAYWNAFECLVEAVNILQPPEKPSGSDKQSLLDQFFSNRSGKITASTIQTAYQEIVNPGFVGKASHALRVCFPTQAESYIRECFKAEKEDERLYNIRNAINHGEVDSENLEELLRIEGRLRKLWIIVWGMFGRLVPFPYPIDRESPPNQEAKLPSTC